MFMQQAVPEGEESKHIASDACPCHPIIRNHNGMLFLWHRSFDHREWWMAIEVLLGFRCKEHLAFIDRETYKVGQPHEHTGEPAEYFEYEHKL